MCVLTIQSRVASGYVGNTAAVPCLQRLGIEAVAVDTAMLSNHPAHGSFRGSPTPPETIAGLIDGVAGHLPLAGFRAVLSGYLGAPATGPIVLDTVARVKASAGAALYCLDPVMGDNGWVYVDPGLVAFFRDTALPAADLVTPNAFEAGLLLGGATIAFDDAVAALERLRAMGPRWAVITGISADGDRIASVAGDASGSWRVTVPRVTAPDSGAGDAFTAILLGVLLDTAGDLMVALGHAAAAVHAILTATAGSGRKDLALVAALDAVLRPPQTFPVERIG